MSQSSPSLSQPVIQVLAPLFEVLPVDRAMSQLVVTQTASPAACSVAQRLMDDPLVQARPAVAAALWLYVDDLDKSHTISQNIDDATGSYWHGIMHRREGDFSNSHYWFRRVGNHPAIAQVQANCNGQYDPHQFIDQAEQAHQRGQTPQELIDLQRIEWLTVLAWSTR